MSKTVTILGATGSVGMQAIDVARTRGYKIDALSANRDVRTMESLAREFRPRAVAMADPSAARDLKLRLCDTDICVYSGEEGIASLVGETNAETVVNSILGEAGLIPSLAAIDAGKRLALANKESLVIAGDIVMSRARERGVEIIPVDSEHSAIFQSLKAGRQSEIKSIILTASGGPFFGYTREMLNGVTLADTLSHPTWKMGKKITVDSATLMNKGFELIEAVHLFSVAPERVRVTIHRESILHSAVEYIDNSVVGELSVPDMRMCVQYAVDYPERQPSASPALDLIGIGSLSFYAPDTSAFPFLDLARRAITLGGAMPAIMNAADEVAVAAFLNEKIGFTDIYDAVTNTFELLTAHRASTDLDGIIAADREARAIANEQISKIGGI
ncbi:MAG: 1-deoxy-D-xylulose-5-phosphate reductoisomerase [Clostridia bacterium]|nr:1-deoxy-D-xylulose-5-phosphate reductoisomerase [Clostridia bacterium]